MEHEFITYLRGNPDAALVVIILGMIFFSVIVLALGSLGDTKNN